MSSQIALKEERPFARVTWGNGSSCWEGDRQEPNAGRLWLVFHRTIRGHPSDPSYRTRRVGVILLQVFWEDFPSCCRAAGYPPTHPHLFLSIQLLFALRELKITAPNVIRFTKFN